MSTIKKLQTLVYDLNIPFSVLAPYCYCHSTSLRNYADQKYQPTIIMLDSIERGIQNFIKDVNKVNEKEPENGDT